MSKSPDAKGGLPRGRGRERAAAHLGGAAGTPVGLACGAAWARACGASLPSPWPPASPSCRSRPCGEPSGSQALSPGRIGPGRAWGGAVPSDLVPTDMVYEAVAHVQTPAGLAAQPRAGIPCRLHSDPGYRTAVTATTAAELRPPAAGQDFRPRTRTSGSDVLFSGCVGAGAAERRCFRNLRTFVCGGLLELEVLFLCNITYTEEGYIANTRKLF